LLAAIPRPWGFVALAAVLATLGFGTIRAVSPSWRRPSARSVAAYLDRSAPPHDPVAMVAFIGQPAITAQVRKRHVFTSLAALRLSTPPGGVAHLVIEDAFARQLHVPTVPSPPKGFMLVGHRHFPSAIMAFDVSAYRRQSSR